MDPTNKTLMEYALKLIGKRRYTVRELREKLEKKIRDPRINVEFEEIEKVISRLQEYGYLNDLDYTGAYIRDQLARKPQGIRLLKTSLSQKGIPSEIINSAIDTQKIDELELAGKAVSKKQKSLQKFSQQARREKLYRFLLSRGFNMETITKIISLQ
jgi:regulatory protein